MLSNANLERPNCVLRVFAALATFLKRARAPMKNVFRRDRRVCRHWTSPAVRIVVCTKTITAMFPHYEYCAQPVDASSPSPAYIQIPDLAGQSFQVDFFFFFLLKFQVHLFDYVNFSRFTYAPIISSFNRQI